MPQTPVSTSWVPVGDTGFEAFLALPPAGSGPGLVLWQEIFGVNAHIRALAAQYALAGYVVLAPDVFWRQAPRIELGYDDGDRQRGMALAKQLKPDEVQADIRAAVAALKGTPATAGAKLGAIGYCLGGRLAFQTAALTDIDAAVAYYGGGIHTQLELAAQISCPMLFHFAGRDDHIPPEAVAQVRTAMGDKADAVHVYPDAQHGFNCWARASYHVPSAALALGRSLTFLAQRLF